MLANGIMISSFSAQSRATIRVAALARRRLASTVKITQPIFRSR
jgi:DNA-binding MurR/RpiR family transcriptional regulator